MKCKHCQSTRILEVSSKASDLHSWSIGNYGCEDGYLPDDFGIGGGDYIDFSLCLDCGKVDGEFPLPVTEYELNQVNEDDQHEDD